MPTTPQPAQPTHINGVLAAVQAKLARLLAIGAPGLAGWLPAKFHLPSP